MAGRAELELRAAAVNVTASSYPNDSTLEHAVLRAERGLAASGAATTQAASELGKRGVSDGTTTATT